MGARAQTCRHLFKYVCVLDRSVAYLYCPLNPHRHTNVGKITLCRFQFHSMTEITGKIDAFLQDSVNPFRVKIIFNIFWSAVNIHLDVVWFRLEHVYSIQSRQCSSKYCWMEQVSYAFEVDDSKAMYKLFFINWLMFTRQRDKSEDLLVSWETWLVSIFIFTFASCSMFVSKLWCLNSRRPGSFQTKLQKSIKIETFEFKCDTQS